MKFIANSNRLLKQLTAIQSVINTSSIVSILENFLFILEKNELSIVACDLETTAIVKTKVESDDSGRICIPSKILVDSLKNLADQPLTFKIDTNKYIIETSSSSGKYKMTGSNPEEFPKIPKPSDSSKSFQIPVSDLLLSISKVFVAISNDDMRPEMNGALLEMNPNYLRMVSTDSHRLVVCTLDTVQCAQEEKIIIPKKPLNLLRNTLVNYEQEEATIQTSDNHFFVRLSNFEIVSRLIDAKFPDYTVVMPEKNPFHMIVNRNELQSSLNRVGVFSNKSTHMVKLEIKGQNLNLFAQDLDYAFEANENLACKYEGDDIIIGFNSKFLVELLQITSTDEVRIEFSIPAKPAILLPESEKENYTLTSLIMPLMIPPAVKNEE